MQHDWMQWIICSMAQSIPIECSGFHAAWLNAVDFLQHGQKNPGWMQWIPCSVIECRNSRHCGAVDLFCMQWRPCSEAQCIPIECSGFYAMWLSAVDSMQHEVMEPYWMQWVLCSMIECSGFLQHDWMQWILCSMAQSIPIECSGFHAASLNAVDSMHCDGM